MAYKESDFGIQDEKEIREEHKEKRYKVALIIRNVMILLFILACVATAIIELVIR